MPYLALDLDAREKCELVARACDARPGDVLWGLTGLWLHVWRTESATVPAVVLAGCFGAHQGMPDALEAFGFIERTPEGIRIRGAERYLRIRQAQREGGKAGRAKSSSKVGNPAAPKEPHKVSSRSTSRSTSRSAQALTASSEQRAPNSEERQKPSAEKPADPRHRPLVKALKDAAPGNCFLSPKTAGRDAATVSDLLAISEPEEILKRWRRALGRGGFPTVRTLPELLLNWPHFAADGPSRPGAPIDPLTQGHRTEGPITAEEVQL